MISRRHIIIKFEAFQSKIDGGNGPVNIPNIHWNEDHVLGKNIDLRSNQPIFYSCEGIAYVFGPLC
jgi:hypothetical protein